MGNHEGANAGRRLGMRSRRGTRIRALRDWPVQSRLLAVIVLALVMSLVFGGLRVFDAVRGAGQFGRVAQLAGLSDQVTVLVQNLQDERDTTAAVAAGASSAPLNKLYAATDKTAASVRQLAAGVGGGFPANIQATVAEVASEAGNITAVRNLARVDENPTTIITDYAGPISDMIALGDQVGQGISDSVLANDVRSLNSLAQAKEQASQQRALLYSTLTQGFFSVGVETALNTAASQEVLDETAFSAAATGAENATVSGILSDPEASQALTIEQFMLSDSAPFQDLGNLGIGGHPPTAWFSLMSGKLAKMQAVERQISTGILARAQALQSGAQSSALVSGIATLLALLIVLAAAVAMARSLVRPLERLRAGALEIATVELPERVRRLGEAQDDEANLEVTPIDVASRDEIGQVARAFDQVHREAVRLAGNEAMLRGSFNAMFVNLSRRSQVLIERLARQIDTLEQNEENSGRLSELFSMDHLVTRMRRNSENLLLLAGHEGARRWSEPAPLADVARAAASEIEHYGRVSVRIAPGIAVAGQAVSDIARLLAELIENATMFSPADARVRVSARELPTGGVLVEVADLGVGISPARLAELNERLENPPVMDVSVSRHMGLFAVGRLAQRHGARVRLRHGNPQGLAALVWLPDSLIERHTVTAPRSGWGSDDTLPRMPVAVSPGPVSPVVATPVPALASSRWFSNPGDSPAGGPRPGDREGQYQAQPPGYPLTAPPARFPAEPVWGDQTAAGLPVRVPRANLRPGSVGSGASGHYASGAGAARPAGAPASAPRRSPEHARSRLSGFQRGARRAKDTMPGAGEDTGR